MSQALSNEIDEGHTYTLKDIGLKIIEKCGCLPLAVKVMGGLLRERGGLRRDWEHVLDDSKWSVTKMPPEIDQEISKKKDHTVIFSVFFLSLKLFI